MAQKRILSSEITIYKDRTELDKADGDLLEAAELAATKAYAPYSGFSVGAAVLLAGGQVVRGNNQENIAYPSGLCAERVALFYASAQFANVPVKAIAITALGKTAPVQKPVSPCGACRQAIAEYELRFRSPVRIIMSGQTGEVYTCDSIETLLPLLFKEESLTKQDR